MIVAPTLSARARGGGGLGTDFDCDGGLIGPGVSPALKARDYKGPSSDGDGDGDGAPLIVHSLRADGFDASEDGTGRGTPLVAATLRAGGSTPASHGKRSETDRDTLVFDTTQITHPENRCHPQPGDPCHPLAAGAHAPAVAQNSSVRRITPRECERLQGFPDDYTLTPYRGKPAADGPRYRALGNSMAVPVVRWIGERIAREDAND